MIEKIEKRIFKSIKFPKNKAFGSKKGVRLTIIQVKLINIVNLRKNLEIGTFSLKFIKELAKRNEVMIAPEEKNPK